MMHLKRHLSTTGVLVGTFFLAMSLTPSLLARPAVIQGLVSGLSLAAGYGIGVFGKWLWTYLHLPISNNRIQKIIKLVTAGISCSR